MSGRLAHSILNYDQKHSIVLTAGIKLIKLKLQYSHLREFHVGPHTLLNTVRQKYWLISRRNIAQSVVHKSVKFIKNKPIIANQVKGNLFL